MGIQNTLIRPSGENSEAILLLFGFGFATIVPGTYHELGVYVCGGVGVCVWVWVWMCVLLELFGYFKK